MSEGIMARRTVGRGERRRAAGEEAGPGRRLLGPLVGLLAAVVGVEVVVQLLLMPRMVVRNIHISSDLDISEQELLAIAGIGPGERYLSVDASEIERRLEACPLVREASVQKVFPDTLRLAVAGRTPLAVAMGRSGDRTVPVLFDEEGVVFRIGGAGRTPDLPVVSGLSFSPALGIALPPMLRPLLRDLAALRAGSPELFGLVSEIKVAAINSVDYELDFYPVGHRVKVRLADRIDETMLRYVFLVIDVLVKTRSAAEGLEIDLRGGEVVYRTAR